MPAKRASARAGTQGNQPLHHPMPPFVSKLSPEQWAEARCLRTEGESFASLARRFGLHTDTVVKRARRERWDAKPNPPSGKPAARSTKARQSSPGTIDTRRRLAHHLYGYLETKITMMEKRMKKEADAAKRNADAAAPTYTDEEQRSFAALIHSINQVTEMASEPASAANGGRKSAINPELTALSDELDDAGLAEASEKDSLRRELAQNLGVLFPKS